MSFDERIEIGMIERPLCRHAGWLVSTGTFAWDVVGGVPQDPVGSAEFLVGEEPGLSVAHRDHQAITDVAVVVEEEQARVPGFRVTVDVDLVVQRVTGLRAVRP